VLLRTATIFCVVFLYCLWIDVAGVVSFRLREYNYDYFLAGMILFVIVSYFNVGTIEEAQNDPKILSLQQTNEWKGIMQVGFLLYHYFRTGANNYNLIRLFIGAYVFMTGFGNTISFTKNRNFSLLKTLKTVLRINLLAIFLCIVMNNEYMLYYFSPLVTFFYLLVYVTLLPLKFMGKDSPTTGIVLALSVFGILLMTLLYSNQSIFYMLMTPLKFLLSYEGSLYEWYFRSRLDIYCVFLGIITATLLPKWKAAQLWFERIPTLPRKISMYAVGTLVFAILGILYWKNILNIASKVSYNNIHPYTSWIAILLYITFRNCTPFLRTHYLIPFEKIGEVSLEIYLLQFHIWLADDAKSIVVFLENFPMLNMVITSCIFYLCSRALYNATNVAVDYISTSIPRIGIFAAIIVLFYGIAHL